MAHVTRFHPQEQPNTHPFEPTERASADRARTSLVPLSTEGPADSLLLLHKSLFEEDSSDKSSAIHIISGTEGPGMKRWQRAYQRRVQESLPIIEDLCDPFVRVSLRSFDKQALQSSKG